MRDVVGAPPPPPPPLPGSFPAEEAAELPPLVLSRGEQRLLRFPGLVRYSLGAPLLRALRDPAGRKDELLLKAVGPGRTDLWVWKKDGRREHRTLEVRAWKEGPPTEIERRLGELSETEVWITGAPRASPEGGLGRTSRTVYALHGEVTTDAEATRIGRLLASFPGQIESRVEIEGSLFDRQERALRKWVAASRWKTDLDVTADPPTSLLSVRGSVDDPLVKAKLETALRAQAPLATLELEALPDRDPTVHFKVYLLELRKNRARTVGLDFPAAFPSALRASSLGVRTALSIDAALQALENEGSARILSQPELVVRAPGEAELFAGGEVPIESKTAYSSRVEWRSYGLSLKLKVQGATGKRVRADVQTEVSHLDPKVTESAIPGLQANRMKTQIDATFGRPLLLSGLLQEGVKKAARGLPFLRDVPVIGALFGSQDFLEDRSELVAVLLPSRNVPEAPRTALGIDVPRGKVPSPRNYLSPSEESELRSDPAYPWNAFTDDAGRPGTAPRDGDEVAP